MSDRFLSPVAYIVIDVILVILTFVTIGVSFLPASASVHLASGMAIALVKASLVVLFFMHALISPAQTRAVVVVAVFWLVFVFMALTLSDYFTRGMIPNIPGH